MRLRQEVATIEMVNVGRASPDGPQTTVTQCVVVAFHHGRAIRWTEYRAATANGAV